MAYTSVVCVKQVPDTKRITGDAMRPDGTVNRAALPAIFNPEDRNALEAALQVRERHGGTVTAITMGLPSACEILREALMRGADRGILITDRRAAASDTLATSYILACAIRNLKPDLVFCGRQAIDGDTAQVGPQLAEKLGFTLMTYLESLTLEGRTARVRRNIGTGTETALAELPALLTVMDTAGELRPPAMKMAMKFKKARAAAELTKLVDTERAAEAPEARTAEVQRRAAELAGRGLLIDQWNLEDIGADLAWCGGAGSPTRVHRIQSIVLTGGDYREFDATQTGVNQLIGELISDHTIG